MGLITSLVALSSHSALRDIELAFVVKLFFRIKSDRTDHGTEHLEYLGTGFWMVLRHILHSGTLVGRGVRMPPASNITVLTNRPLQGNSPDSKFESQGLES